jgi:hypothetical protein
LGTCLAQAVDDAWHAFILFTRSYDRFCQPALGRFLHHTPAEAMVSPTIAQEGIKRAWNLACRREGIDPKAPARLPLLFAIDAMLGIPDGFRSELRCSPGEGSSGYCASHIGCTSCGGGCGGDSGCGGGGAAAISQPVSLPYHRTMLSATFPSAARDAEGTRGRAGVASERLVVTSSSRS